MSKGLWKWKKESEVTQSCLFAAPWTVAHQTPPSMEFSRQEYWNRLPFPPPEVHPDPGIKPTSPMSPVLQVDSLLLSHQRSPFVIMGGNKNEEFTLMLTSLPSWEMFWLFHIKGELFWWSRRWRIHLQCRRLMGCGFDPWVGKIPWKREWQSTPVFLPIEFHGQKSLVD